MAKTYETVFALGAKIDASFGKAFTKAQKQLDATSKQADIANKVFGRLGGAMKAAAVAVAGYASYTVVKDFLSSSVEAAKEAIDASTKLQTVMKNTKGVTDQQITGLIKYADSMQKIGVVEGDVIVAGMQQVGTFQLQAATIKTLVPGMADLLAQQNGLNATSEDAVGIGNLMGKVMNGQVGALSRVGVSFTKAQEKALKFGTETERAATLAAVLKMNVGGVNKALRATDQGKIQAMNNAWGDMKEVIGMAILPALARFASIIERNIPAIQAGLEKSVKFGVKAFDKAFNYVQKTYLNNPYFKNLTFYGKINFILDDISAQFQIWLDGGGSEKVRNFGATVGQLIGEGVISIAPTLFETAGKMAVSSFIAGLRDSPIGAFIAGGLAGAVVGAPLMGIGAVPAFFVGGTAAAATHVITGGYQTPEETAGIPSGTTGQYGGRYSAGYLQGEAARKTTGLQAGNQAVNQARASIGVNGNAAVINKTALDSALRNSGDYSKTTYSPTINVQSKDPSVRGQVETGVQAGFYDFQRIQEQNKRLNFSKQPK